jgi:hypothetical protein
MNPVSKSQNFNGEQNKRIAWGNTQQSASKKEERKKEERGKKEGRKKQEKTEKKTQSSSVFDLQVSGAFDGGGGVQIHIVAIHVVVQTIVASSGGDNSGAHECGDHVGAQGEGRGGVVVQQIVGLLRRILSDAAGDVVLGPGPRLGQLAVVGRGKGVRLAEGIHGLVAVILVGRLRDIHGHGVVVKLVGDAIVIQRLV